MSTKDEADLPVVIRVVAANQKGLTDLQTLAVPLAEKGHTLVSLVPISSKLLAAVFSKPIKSKSMTTDFVGDFDFSGD